MLESFLPAVVVSSHDDGEKQRPIMIIVNIRTRMFERMRTAA